MHIHRTQHDIKKQDSKHYHYDLFFLARVHLNELI